MVGPGGSPEDRRSMVGSPEDKGSRPDEDLLVIRVPISVWAIHVILCGRSEVCSLYGVALPATK